MKLAERIEAAFDRAMEARAEMYDALREIEAQEETAKMDNLDEWTGAKNNDVRRAVVLRALADSGPYHAQRTRYRDNRDAYRLALLEIERLKLLVEVEKADAARYSG